MKWESWEILIWMQYEKILVMRSRQNLPLSGLEIAMAVNVCFLTPGTPDSQEDFPDSKNHSKMLWWFLKAQDHFQIGRNESHDERTVPVDFENGEEKDLCAMHTRVSSWAVPVQTDVPTLAGSFAVNGTWVWLCLWLWGSSNGAAVQRKLDVVKGEILENLHVLKDLKHF